MASKMPSNQLNSQLPNQLNSQLPNPSNSKLLPNPLNSQLPNQLNSKLPNPLNTQLTRQGDILPHPHLPSRPQQLDTRLSHPHLPSRPVEVDIQQPRLPHSLGSRPRLSRPAGVAAPPLGLSVCQKLILAILAFIAVVGLAVLLAWLIVNPKRLFFTIEDASITKFNVTDNHHITATYDFLVAAHNPNRRISVYYDSIELAVSYENQTIAHTFLTPFHQRRRNVTEIDAILQSRYVALPTLTSKDMVTEKANTGDLKLRVRIKTKTRYKVGVFKIRRHTMKSYCSTVVHFSTPKSFEPVRCDSDY